MSLALSYPMLTWQSLCCHDLQAMLLPVNFPAILDPMSESAKLGIQNIFAFCYVWSVGGALEGHARDTFDAMVRSTFQGVAIFPAGAGLVYDHYCDPQRCQLSLTCDHDITMLCAVRMYVDHKHAVIFQEQQ